MARLLLGAVLVAAVAASSPCADCPWYSDTGRRWLLECNDGTLQSWFTGDPTIAAQVNCEDFYDFGVCTNRGGRKTCPQGQIMCASPNRAAGGTDYMCVGADGTCENPVRGVSDPMWQTGTCTTTQTAYQDAPDTAGRRACDTVGGECDYLRDTGFQFYVQCNDGSLQTWFTGDLTDPLSVGCEANYNFAVCTGRGGRARCPPGHTMCASPNLAAGGTDYMCAGNCVNPTRGPSDPWWAADAASPTTCNDRTAYADPADPLGFRICDSSSSEKSLLLLLLLLLLILIPLLISSSLLLLCCIRRKKKGAGTPFATFDPQVGGSLVAPPATFCSGPAPLVGTALAPAQFCAGAAPLGTAAF